MKRVFVLLLCLIVAMGALASCDSLVVGGGEEHTHTFETEWTKDSEGHWYEATCDCEDVEVTKLSHVDANNDGACDICTFTDHTHTYETETWTVNCTSHWRAATCPHIVAGIDKADHEDTDGDGKCDVCNYIIEDIHEHVYDDEWSSDENNHWHAALCEHAVEVADKAPHNLDAAGYCTVCEDKINEIDKTDFLAVINAAIARNGKVTDANVVAQNLVYGTGANGLVLENAIMHDYYFVLGNGCSYIYDKAYDESGLIGIEEYWYDLIGEDDVFCAGKIYGVDENGKLVDPVLAPYSGAAQHLNGYNYIPGSILPSASDDTSTLAYLIAGLYERGNGENAGNFTEKYNAETGEYTFGFTCYNINIVTSSGTTLIEVELYNCAVQFTVDDNGVIDYAVITVEVYRDYEADSDLTYDVGSDLEGNTVVTNIQLKDSANPTYYNYVVSQRSGDRTFVNPYPKASLVPTDFDLYYVSEYDFPDAFEFVIESEELIEDSITVTEGDYVYLHLGDPKPLTASFNFMSSADFSYSFVNKDANSSAVMWDVTNSLQLNGYSAYINCLKIKVLDPGEYTVTIEFGDITKVFDVTVEGEPEPELGEDDENTVNVLTTDNNGWFDLYSYTANAAGTYTFALPAGLGLWSAANMDANPYGNPEVDFNSNASGATVKVALDAGEKYEFYVGATTKDAWAIEVSFEAGEGSGNTGGSDQPLPDYNVQLNEGNNSVKFNTAEIAADSATRTLVLTVGGNYKFVASNLFVASIVDADGNTISKNADYTYDLAAGEYTVTFGMFKNLSVHADTEYTINIQNLQPSGGDTPDVPGGDDIGGEPESDPLKDTLTGVWFNVEGGEGMFLYNYEAGVYLMNVFGEGFDLYFTYTITDNGDGTYTFTPAYFARPDFETGNQSHIDAVLAMEIVGSYDGTEWTFGSEGGDEGGEGGDTESDPVKDSLGGFYNVLDFEVYFFFNSTDSIYFMNVYGEGYDMYFTYTVTDNLDGTYTIIPTYYARPDMETFNEDKLNEILATEFLASYDGSAWTFIYEGSNEPNGSDERPYPVNPDGNVCAFPGGYSPIFYSGTAMLGGYVTVTTDYANALLGLGLDPYNTSNNVGYDENYNTILANSVTIYVPAGYTYYIAISDNDFVEAEISFSVTFTPFFSDDYSALVGTWSAAVESWGSMTYYTLVIDQFAMGTYKEDYGYGVSEYTIEYLVLDGDKIIMGVKDEWNSMTMVMTYVDGTITYQADEYSPVVTFTPGTPDVGGDEGDAPEISYETVIADGENTLYFSADEVSADAATRPLTVTADGNYKLTAGNLYIASIVDANGNVIAKNDDYTYTLTAGEYTVSFAMLSMFGVSADTACTLNVEFQGSEGGEEGGEDVGGDTPAQGSGSGTKDDPYVISTLPYSITMEGLHDFFCTFTATEDVTVVITYSAGCYVSDLPSAAVKDSAAMTYTFTMAAGETVTFNPWNMSSTGEYTYTVAAAAPAEGGDNEGGEDEGNEGNESAGITYIAENANGRKMMVVIDAAAGTMAVTRSDMTGNFGTGGASTANFTYSFADGVVTYEKVGNNSVTAMTFDANGAPLTVTWSGAVYENFTVQE